MQTIINGSHVIKVRQLSHSTYKHADGTKATKRVLGVSLPAEILDTIGLKQNRLVLISADPKSGAITITPTTRKDVEKRVRAERANKK